MHKVKLTLIILILGTSLHGLPRFSALEGVDCATCHVNPAGGGVRTGYGSDYINESLTAYNGIPSLGDLKLSGIIPEGLLVGGDLRIQSIRSDELRSFPMQAVAYGGWEGGNLKAVAELEYRQDEVQFGYTTTWSGLPGDSWISASRQIPAFGLRLDDHTSFVRGGNLSTLAMPLEGMPFDPLGDRPHGVSIGTYALAGFSFQAGTGTAFMTNAVNADSYWFVRGDNAGYVGPLSYTVSLNYLEESDLSLSEIDILGQWSRLAYLGAFSRSENWTGAGISSLAVHHEGNYRLIQGVDLVLRYEFFDPDIDLSNGSIQRWSAGVDLYPVTGIELKVLYRQHTLENVSAYNPDKDPQLLVQLHLYY